jgi:hypothetical protein
MYAGIHDILTIPDSPLQYRKVIDDGKKAFAELSTELRKAQEAFSVANLTIERQRKAGEIKPIPSSQKEAQLQKEVDKCMVSSKHNLKLGRRPRVSDVMSAEHPQVFNV